MREKGDRTGVERYFPVFLKLEGCKCLVVGGGSVAVRKVRTLLLFDVDIGLVSPEVAGELEELAQVARIRVERRPFRAEDLDGVTLVIVSTDDADLNRMISDEARKRNILCNVVDKPELCSVIFPAVVRRGMLQLAISTGGASPALAAFIKKHLSRLFGQEYELALEILQRLRKPILAGGRPALSNKAIFERFVDWELIKCCKAGDFVSIQKRLAQVVGDQTALEILEGEHKGREGLCASVRTQRSRANR